MCSMLCSGRIKRKTEMKESWDVPDGGDGCDKTLLTPKDGKLSLLHKHVKTCLAGNILTMYLGSIVFKVVIEISFIVGQWFSEMFFYVFQLLPEYECEKIPCPHKVSCFVSCAKENKFFIRFMLSMSCISLLLNMLEICSLGWKLFKQRSKLPTSPTPLVSGLERKAFTEDGRFMKDLQLEVDVAQTSWQTQP